jgi:hypothetical protein
MVLFALQQARDVFMRE